MRPNKRTKLLGSDSDKFYVDMLTLCKQLCDERTDQSNCIISYGRIIQTSIAQYSDEDKLAPITQQVRPRIRSTMHEKSCIYGPRTIDSKAQMRRVDLI